MEIFGASSMAQEWGLTVGGAPSKLYADASAALSIARRQGSGHMGHMNVKILWLQEEVQKELDYAKNKGKKNPSDGLTKHVRQESTERYATTVSLTLGKNRDKKSLQLAGQ